MKLKGVCIITEMCPKCFRLFTDTEKVYSFEELEKDLLSGKKLEATPLCESCKNNETEEESRPMYFPVSIKVFEKIKSLIK